jgi:hypothetical protein
MESQTLLGQVSLQFQTEYRDHREDLSAALLTHDQYLWVGSDETASLERLSLIDDQKFGNHLQFQIGNFINIPSTAGEEIDIEGLDYNDHYLWVVGSHSSKRKTVKSDQSDAENVERLATIELEANRYLLARIPLIDGQLVRSHPHPDKPDKKLTAAKLETKKTGNLLTHYLKNDPHLGIYLVTAIPGKENGFDIEGIAVSKNRVFLGLRGPVLRGWAVILELEIKTDKDPTQLKLKKIGASGQRYRKHFVNLAGLGIRDLLAVDQNLLILAGPTMDLDGPVKVFQLDNFLDLPENSLSKPVEVLDIPYGNRDDHAEGIALFSAITQQSSLLVVYDSPCKTTRLKEPNIVTADVFIL